MSPGCDYDTEKRKAEAFQKELITSCPERRVPAESGSCPAHGSAHLWRVTVSDTYTSHTYEIAGTDKASIRDVMNAAKRRLKGKLVREWSGEGGDAPNETSSPAAGGDAHPWIVEPTRAGWWWWLDKRTGQIELVRVKNFGTPWAPHLSAYGDGWGGWTIPLMNEHKPGWWAGPVEPPEMPREEPRPNAAGQRQAPAQTQQPTENPLT